MSAPMPSLEHPVNLYNAAGSSAETSRIYFVNGIQASPRDHARTCFYLSLLLERPIWGVFNATSAVHMSFLYDLTQAMVGERGVSYLVKAGIPFDLAQCGLDYTQNSLARLSSPSNLNKPPTLREDQIPEFLDNVERKFIIWNRATVALFKELVRNRHQQQMIIAHSQGNLITSNALFIVEEVLGSAALQKIRVYSLASPSPAWPVGLRTSNGGGGRQDNAFMNDMVALLRPHNLAKKLGVGGFQNAGDFRTYAPSGPVALAPHDSEKIIETLNFLKSIRKDLGLPMELSPEQMQKASAAAKAAFPNE